jgi:aspartate 1-decarboxylase
MLINLLQAKLHRVRVTRADLHYEGSCGIDEDLLDRSGIREFQHLEIYNIENGERFTTYAIKSSRGEGEICLNGAAARKAAIGDHLIICAYSTYNEAELARYRPIVVVVDEENRPHRHAAPLAAARMPDETAALKTVP